MRQTQNTISAYIQVYRHKRAVFEALKSFRIFYRTEPVTVVSDNGDDFTDVCEALDLHYVHSPIRSMVGPGEQRANNQSTLDGVYEIQKRIYEHCKLTDTDWVVILEADVRTIRRIRSFPHSAIGGARLNPYSQELTDHLIKRFGSNENLFVYGAAGGGIFRRQAYIDAYETNHDYSQYLELDPRIPIYADIPLTLLFHMNGMNYSVWDEVSEILHENSPIVRDSAFDHGYKYWYDKEWDEMLLQAYQYLYVKDFDERLLE